MRSFWIKFACSAACLAVLFWWTDTTEVWTRLRGLDLGWIALALAGMTAATVSMAYRWAHIAQAFGVQIGFGTALREYYLGQLINTALPGGVAGDVTRAVRARHAGDLKSAAQSVVADRLIGQTIMLTMMFTGFAAARALPGGVRWDMMHEAVLITLILCAVVGFGLSRLKNALARFLIIAAGLLASPAILIQGLIASLCLIFSFYACARAVGLAIPPEGWATLIPLTLCAMLIPFSIGGWGWREGAAAALFPFVGMSASGGIATGIAYGVVLLVAALPGVFLLFSKRPAKPLSTQGSHTS
ncbi:lysylphosphatidylglycerol synthase transmembrane domain-containing protein [Yoonia sp. 2307UL14-13]|uniref:lysylphosphatidylglycerol synthase transmembrane domain-containing protein n=1 Tax=Yoonia sp. 2307UL14-13 TaxID=3126506 RepID=UPI0030A3A5CC